MLLLSITLAKKCIEKYLNEYRRQKKENKQNNEGDEDEDFTTSWQYGT